MPPPIIRLFCIFLIILLPDCRLKKTEDKLFDHLPDRPLVTKAEMEENLPDYDSFNYHADVSCFGLKGIATITSEHLLYPLVQSACRSDYVDMYFHFSPRKRIQWRIRDSRYGKMLHLKRYVKDGINAMVHYYLLFQGNETIQLESNQETLSDSMDCYSITRYFFTTDDCMNEESVIPAYRYRRIAVKDAVAFYFPGTDNRFAHHSLRLLELNPKGELSETYTYSKDLVTKQSTERNQVTRLGDGRYSSFAFYFADNFADRGFELVRQ